MLWLFFIVVTTLNLVLGTLTAMYLRRQLELVHADQAAEAAKKASAAQPSEAGGGRKRAKAERQAETPSTATPPYPPSPTPTAEASEELPADLAELRKSLGLQDPANSDPGQSPPKPEAASEATQDAASAADNWAAMTADIAETAVPPGFLEPVPGEDSSTDGSAATSPPESTTASETADETPPPSVRQEDTVTDATCDDIEFLATALSRNAYWEKTLVDLDEELRRAETPNAPEIADQWNRILKQGQDYLADLSALRERSRREDSPPPDVALVRDEIWADWDAAVAEMTGVTQELALLDVRGDPDTTRRQLRVILNRLLSAAYRLRDRMQAAYAARALCEDMASAAIPGPRTDEQTDFLTPLGLQLHLAPWWGVGGRQRRPLLGALLDADRIRDWNDRLGHPVVNEVAAALARFIREIPRQEVHFARLGIAEFLLVSSDLDARSWTQLVEKIRQSVETATFEYRGQPTQLTLAAAVTELTSDDTSQTFLERLHEALAEAKRAGGNRTYSDFGRGPTPLVPANIPVREQIVHVESPDAEPVAATS
ncbi:MAG: GGDEF domain-containing protein [Thermogutta sp.]